MKDYLTNPKILVLGGTGFLGTYLIQELLKRNLAVRIFCQSSKNIKTHPPGLEICEGDFINGRGLEEALDGINIVYHLVSTTIPGTSNLNLAADVQNNLVGSLYLLQKMHEMNINRIIFISSGGTVYGNPSILPVPEDHQLSPLCSYGIVKVAIENYMHMFSTLHNFKTTILRVSNAYGLHQTNIGIQGIITTFFDKIMKGEQLEIWGDGSVVRDFIYITDVVDAMIRVLLMDKLGTYNIGSGKGHSLLEVLSVISNLTGIKPRVKYFPPRPFDVKQIYLDISKSLDDLKWKPSISLDQGCKMYWNLVNKQPHHLCNGIKFGVNQ